MKKIISFSLWGDDPKYCVGAVKNSDLALIHYPGWICRFHIGTSTPAKYIKELQERENVEVVLREESGDWTGMFWRFLDASDTSVDVMISRDTDSRLNHREANAVKEWISSNRKFHIMRDHPLHRTEILGGMWGVRDRYLGDMKHLINHYVKGNFWQVDQNFLKEIIYPIINNNCFIHDEFFDKKAFPTDRKRGFFVGQAFDENDDKLYPNHGDML